MLCLIEGDCCAVLPQLGEAWADACITDPPYGETSLAWDKTARGRWVELVAAALKPSAAFWVFGSMRSLSELFPLIEAHGFRFSQEIVWEKQNGSGFHTDRFRRVHEYAAMFYRGEWAKVYKEAQYTFGAKPKTVRREGKPAHFIENGDWHGKRGETNYRNDGRRLMRSVLRIRNQHRRGIHPTQKPVELLSHLVRYSVPHGGVVVDPFSGSGSLGMAARECGRNAVLIEAKPEFAELSRGWLGLDRDPEAAAA